MKIGIIIGSLGFGGAERVSVRLAEWWYKKGNEVSFYTTKQPPEKEYTLSEGIQRFFCHEVKNQFDLIRKLRKAIVQDQPDAVIIMDTPMCVYGVPALLGTEIPFIVSERSDPKTARIKTKTKILSRTLMHFADGYVFQTKGARDYFSKTIRKRSVIIANPLLANEIPEPFFGEREKNVVNFSRLVQGKNYPLLIEAFSRFARKHPEYKLEIYGDGPERENIERVVSKSEASGQIHLNHSRGDILQIVRESGIFVLSSDMEGMPNALIEAMALGIPSISTDCPPGGPADLITDGVNGLLVPVRDVEALSTAMIRLAEDTDLQKKIGHKAAEIRETHDIEKIGYKWNEILAIVIEENRP